ncbi:MAG: uridine phosphorylase [Chloroflexi bacterium]|nr:uridine phosphorylase [Chloroflexota bacterium]
MAVFEADGRLHHLGIRAGDVGRYVLLPGDPGRVEVIARRFDDPRFVASHREYTTWTGSLDGVPVSCTSTGIGCPSTAIAVEELAAAGADTFIRVGTSGAMQRHLRTGDIAVVSGAIRDEGTSRHYLPIEFPAVADIDVTVALRDGARAAGHPFHVGVAQSKDSFYGQHEPQRMPIAAELGRRWDAWMAGGAICSEMEAATLFVVASTLRVRAGGVMLVFQNMDHRPPTAGERAAGDVERVVDAAILGLRRLIADDRARAAAGADASR